MMARRLFELRNPRERILLTAFLWLLLLLWLVFQGRVWRGASYQFSAARAELRSQQVYLDEAAEIEARLLAAQGMIDHSRTYTAIQLSSVVDNMARDAGLPADIRSPERREEGIFNTYSVRVDARRATLEQLMLFTQAVRSQAPYLSIRSMEIRSNARDPNQLDSVIVVETFELTESTF